MINHTDDLDLAAFAEIIADHFSLEPQWIRFRSCDTGRFNHTYFVDGTPEPVVLRIAPIDDPSRYLFYEYKMMRQEPDIYEILGRDTTVPVPEIFLADFSGTSVKRDFLVMERLDGFPVSDHPDLTSTKLDDVLRSVGRYLREVHEVTSNKYGYLREGVMDPMDDWPSAFSIIWNRLLDDIEGCGGYEIDQTKRLRHLLDEYTQVFDREVPASLLHMDVWGQNILADSAGKLTGLIDWDRSLWGDPEIEFAVLDYCGISEPPFWEGYGQTRDTSTEAKIRKVFYVLYELQKYIFIRSRRGGSPREIAHYRKQALDLASCLS
ncbi:MAG: phosphotransferase family protein [Gemmataceae bacterium]